MDSLITKSVARFEKAFIALERALALSPLPERADRDAVLLRFELAAELMPKTLRRILSVRGADVPLPKDAVRTALSAGVIDETIASVLLAAIDDRNRMVHDYGEEFSDALFARVRADYFPAFRTLTARMHEEANRV